MSRRAAALLLAAIVGASTASAVTNNLPIYIEDNHAGTFYWLARQVDLEEPCTLIHFDAHSDASAIFDSDEIRSALRKVASPEERQQLLEKWRSEGAVQCFNWIEPLVPAPVAKVIWVPGPKLAVADANQRAHEATALLDGHLEAAPRSTGTFRDRYIVSDLEHLPEQIGNHEPVIVTIDLDYFAAIPGAEQAGAFERVWSFVLAQPNLRAVTFAISRPYLTNDEEADRLVQLALNASLALPTARLQFEPFVSVAHDRSARARELEAAGRPLPSYDINRAPQEMRATLLAQSEKIVVQHDPARWETLLQDWRNEAPQFHLEVKDAQQSTDGIWRISSRARADIEVVAEPWTAKPQQVEWFALTPKYPSCNVTNLRTDQVGFVAEAAPRPAWTEIPLPCSGAMLPIDKIDHFFDRQWHCGSLRLGARVLIDGKVRETPIVEVRRSWGDGFRAAVSEQFGLPYLFGVGELSDGTGTGTETNLGADCANFVVFAMRRQGIRVPWSDAKGLRQRLDPVASSVAAGAATFSPAELDRGLIVHLGAHVAAVMEDRPPLGVLDESDLVAHQLKGIPEVLTLGALLRDRKKGTFDLFSVPVPKPAATLVFGGDVMLGRSCAQKIYSGINPFAGIRDLLTHSTFAVANLESVISNPGRSGGGHAYSFQAPLQSARLLRSAGFRAIGLANNHALDFGADALIACAAQLSREQVEPVGAGEEPYAAKYFPLAGGKTLALLAITDVTDHCNPRTPVALASDRARLQAALEQARSRADFVACLVHWGVENTSIVTEKQRGLARWLVDHGVDAVIGSHPHCLQPLDFYHGCPIAYSLGNLVFDGAPTVTSWNEGALLRVELSDEARVSAVDLIPIHLKDGLPQITSSAQDVLAKQ